MKAHDTRPEARSAARLRPRLLAIGASGIALVAVFDPGGTLGLFVRSDAQRRPADFAISTGGSSPFAGKALLDRITAYEGEARVAGESLHVVVLDLTDRTPERLSGGGSPAKLRLDLSSAQGAAVLAVTGDAIEWAVTPSPSRPRARLALEGRGQVTVSGGHPGLLAGYRIGDYGQAAVAQPADLLTGQGTDRFCQSLKIWRRRFDIDRKDVWIWAMRDATRVTVTDRGVHHDGEAIPGLPAVNLLCAIW